MSDVGMDVRNGSAVRAAFAESGATVCARVGAVTPLGAAAAGARTGGTVARGVAGRAAGCVGTGVGAGAATGGSGIASKMSRSERGCARGCASRQMAIPLERPGGSPIDTKRSAVTPAASSHATQEFWAVGGAKRLRALMT
jgi:hypothetical protein